MISEIKDYLKTLALTVTLLPDDKCYLTAKDEATYKLPGWISILTLSAKPEKTMTKDNIKDETGKIIVVTQKYRITQPVKIAFSGSSETEVDAWIQAFLSGLKSGIIIEQGWVEIAPTQIEYADSESKIRAQYLGSISIDFNYGIYTGKEYNKISEVTLLAEVNYE
ncbi:MAG: hypothetical protein JXB50_02215 [Spirochaetes bacterium]|nr:hypothetical protein [Spirochaetota bacterium]